ncbi:MAG TPA: hypothetical protein DEF80_17315 [Pantoea sp.]|nr:hypothetical protein [Pantoea sp.]
MLVVHLIPAEVTHEHRESAVQASRGPVSRITAGVFIVIWIICGILLVSSGYDFMPLISQAIAEIKACFF